MAFCSPSLAEESCQPPAPPAFRGKRQKTPPVHDEYPNAASTMLENLTPESYVMLVLFTSFSEVPASA